MKIISFVLVAASLGQQIQQARKVNPNPVAKTASVQRVPAGTGSLQSSTFCKQTPLNGGSICVSTSQGLIPLAENMISTLIIFPENGQSLGGDEGFDIVFETINLISGKSLNLKNQYLALPQTLDPQTGMIEGMQSISIQPLQSQIGNDLAFNAPDANVFSFYQILNTRSDSGGKTSYTTTVKPRQIKTRGLHRICTLAMSRSGMAAIMPIAQRGAQDDCIRVFID